MNTSNRYGWLAGFGDAASLLNAIAGLHAAGYTRMEVYSPFPLSEERIDGFPEALHMSVLYKSRHNSLARLMLIGGLIGGIGTLVLEWYASTIAYPMNIGGRPDASWPLFIPAALEMIFLFAALFGVAGMLINAGLPQLYHPAFNVEHFAKASGEGFFVMVCADDPRLNDNGPALQDLLAQFEALTIDEVAL